MDIKKRKSTVFLIVTIVLASLLILLLTTSYLRKLGGVQLETTQQYFLILISFHITQTYVLCSFQFIFPVHSIKLRFEVLNRNLEHYFLENSTGSPTKNDGIIKRLAGMHDKLSDAIDLVNSIFSIQLIPGIIFALAMNIFFLLTLIQIILGYHGSPYTTISNMLWGVYFSFYLISCIFVASAATEEANRVGPILHKIINHYREWDVGLMQRVGF